MVLDEKSICFLICIFLRLYSFTDTLAYHRVDKESFSSSKAEIKGMNNFLLPSILSPPSILLPPFISTDRSSKYAADNGFFPQSHNLKALLHRKDGTSNIHPLPIRTNNLPTPSNRQRKCLPRRHRHLRASRPHSPYLRRILSS